MFLQTEDRATLEQFVAGAPPDAAYLRRAQILLLHDDGLPAETIAGQVGVTIVQSRNWLRAYKRQGMVIFPPELFQSPPLFTPDEPVAEAGRRLLAETMEQLAPHFAAVREEADATGIHEARKGLRQLRTGLRLLALYFEAGLLNGYYQRFRKGMRRLGRSRDLHVFLEELNRFIAQEQYDPVEREELLALAAYWEEQKKEADQAAQAYLERQKWERLLADFDRFTQTTGAGALPAADRFTPVKVSHVAPILIYQQLAVVRAGYDQIDRRSLTALHRLRLEVKRLRLTILFFQPLLGSAAAELAVTLKQLQDYLGQINDANVALDLLAQTPQEELLSKGAALYRQSRQAELEWLLNNLDEVWEPFDQPAWRRKLAAAVTLY